MLDLQRALAAHGVGTEAIEVAPGGTFADPTRVLFVPWAYRSKVRGALEKIYPGLSAAEIDFHTRSLLDNDLGDQNVVVMTDGIVFVKGPGSTTATSPPG